MIESLRSLGKQLTAILLLALVVQLPWPARLAASETAANPSRCNILAHGTSLSVDVSRVNATQALRALATATGATIYVEGNLPEMTLTLTGEKLTLFQAVDGLALGSNFAIQYRGGVPTIWIFGTPASGAADPNELSTLADAPPVDEEANVMILATAAPMGEVTDESGDIPMATYDDVGPPL